MKQTVRIWSSQLLRFMIVKFKYVYQPKYKQNITFANINYKKCQYITY